jgi:RimJ/RimL family protein N-acetyltransferase
MKAADMTFRGARPEDAAFAADLITAVNPDDPLDPVQLAHRWQNPDSNEKVERFIGEIDGEHIAYAWHRHTGWEQNKEHHGYLGGEVLPPHRTPERLDALTAAMEELSRADGIRLFVTSSWEHNALRLAVLTKRGYREQRRGRFWELDLTANRKRLEEMTAESRAKMRDEGIRVLTIDRDDDPDRWTKLWRMSEEALKDVPTTVPIPESTFEDFMKWMRTPGLREDRLWIARDGDAIIGVSLLSYPPSRGVVQTDWTGVGRAGRGRGVARALKCETVMQAIALGVDRVRTDNDSTNAPILHINETMGYVRRPDMLELMREA